MPGNVIRNNHGSGRYDMIVAIELQADGATVVEVTEAVVGLVRRQRKLRHEQTQQCQDRHVPAATGDKVWLAVCQLHE